jgi:Tol biopolymer transport system component
MKKDRNSLFKAFTNLFIFGVLFAGCSNSVFLNPRIYAGLNSRAVDQHPSFSADGRYLVFASDRNGSRNIYLYDLEQKRFLDLPNLNHRNSCQDQPSISADARYIAYVSTERGRPDIMIYDRNSARSELITANIKGDVANPVITQDGTKVAFEATQLGQWHIAIVDR